MLAFLDQRYEFPYVRCYVLCLEICHGGISVGTALRAFGLSGDQRLYLDCNSAVAILYFLITNSLGWISLPPLLS